MLIIRLSIVYEKYPNHTRVETLIIIVFQAVQMLYFQVIHRTNLDILIIFGENTKVNF